MIKLHQKMLQTLVGKTIKSQEVWSDTNPESDFNKHFFITTVDGMTFYQMFSIGLDQTIVFEPIALEERNWNIQWWSLILIQVENRIDTLECKTIKSCKTFGNPSTVHLQKFYFLETTENSWFALVFSETFNSFNQFEPIMKGHMDFIITDNKLVELEATDYHDV